MTRAEWYAIVKPLRDRGMLHREIQEVTGLSRSYVSALLHDPDRAKELERRERYRRPCPECGVLMDGSNGTGPEAPRHCAPCSAALSRIWTEEAVIAAIQRFAAEHGRPPVATEWLCGKAERGDYPPATACYGRGSFNPSTPFESWADAIEAAGFERPLIGKYERTEEVRARISAATRRFRHEEIVKLAHEGLPYGKIAEAVGCARGTAANIARGEGIERGQGWRPTKEGHMPGGNNTRPYLVFREGEDGTLSLIGETEQTNTVDAVEALVQEPGRYAAVATGSLQRMTLQSKLVAEKIPPRAASNDEGPT